ncbi:MAG: NADH-quinone oxidoreductase subunit G, partial [Proteobacteria bacterium]|nr:NADH-quinone oxidoreductase subunit G [Pseudomonadota bacterium]
VAEAPQFALLDRVPDGPGPDPAIWDVIGADGPLDTNTALRSSVHDFYLTNPIARASETMAECSRLFVQRTKMAAE